MHARVAWLLGALVLLLHSSSVRAQDEKIVRQLMPPQMEGMLKAFDIEYKKSESKPAGTFFYDFERNRYKLRLHLFGGKDIMLDSVFKEYPLEKLNDWNRGPKFSRVVLYKGDKGEFTALESNLDLRGGVTQATVEQFFKTFDQELEDFDRFLKGGESPPPKDEKIVTEVSNEMLEKILSGLKIEFKKNVGKGVTVFDFESNKHMLRLTNFGGKDLMIDAHFKVIPLAKINTYNTDNKFIRAVLYKMNNSEYVALESNLDCVGGVTESIVRYFINVYADDAKRFSKYVQDNQE